MLESSWRQVLSRTVNLLNAESQVVLSPQFPPEKRYRLSVSETSGTGRALITVDMLHSQNEQQIQFHVSPFGGTAIELSGSAIISALAQVGNATLVVNITEIMPSIEIVNFREGITILGAGFVDLGSNGGFPQPYYNYARVYLTGAADIQLVNIAGVVHFQALGLPAAALLLNQMFIGADLRLQARGAGTNATVVWYNRT